MPVWRCAILGVSILLSACAPLAGRDVPVAGEPLVVHGSTATVEIAPVLLAARDYYPAGAVVRDGGIPNLIGVSSPGFGEPGVADVATHAETQALRYSVAHPDIRIILTVTEGHYRIVARRSAGIATLADLKGKRIATLANTSAGYFLGRMLARAGLRFEDIEPVRITPLADMAKALDRREVDAVAIWEPHSGNAARMLGGDLIAFDGAGVYRERFNLNTTAANLADPMKRGQIMAFVRALVSASQAVRSDPTGAQALVATTSGFDHDEVVRSWPFLSFPASIPADLLDTLVAEETWLAAQDGRAPRSRETLAGLIDRSVLAEATRP